LEASRFRCWACSSRVFQYLKGAIGSCASTSEQPRGPYFNTSKVRLEAGTAAGNSPGDRYFNTSKVRLEGPWSQNAVQTLTHFNTSKVRLEVALVAVPLGCDIGFQYLKGAIGSGTDFSGITQGFGISIPQRCDWKPVHDHLPIEVPGHFNTSKVRLEGTRGRRNRPTA